MKKVLILVLALSLVAVGAVYATIVGSKHDMRQVTGIAAGTTQVCVYCHHPHRGVDSSGTITTGTLLWNMKPGYTTFSSYNTYASASMNATTSKFSDFASASGNQLYSLYCLACHDGNTSGNALVRAPKDGTAGTLSAIGTQILDHQADIVNASGNDLTNDHPVNFNYTTDNDAGIKAFTVGTGGSDVVIGNITATTYPLYGGTMQCATCHDVHNGTKSAKDNGIQFMRGTTAIITGSTICRDCHTNK
ncbi:MAG: hypothetical protein M0Z59_05590 [Nitrospiraceae bacterium]|nr:hypothetical protein [Nitrospiraceae bacterium]